MVLGFTVLVACWSAKGGVGCSVVAASLALTLARRRADTLLVDICGDQSAILGLDTGDPEAAGLAAWLDAGDDVPADGLARLERPVGAGLHLIVAGGTVDRDVERHRVLARLWSGATRTVVVDAGRVHDESPLLPHLTEAQHSLAVTRPCYLAVRRLHDLSVRPSGVVVVDEPGRALDQADVEAAVGSPVALSIGLDPAIARAVDAGLLVGRMPRSLARSFDRFRP